MRAWMMLGFGSLAMVACSTAPEQQWNNNGGGNGGQPDAGTVADLADPPDLTPPPPMYPKGPYGNQTGKTLPNLKLQGYRLTPAQTDATKLTWDKTIQLGDYYQNPKCACMVITVGATWCGYCKEEQRDLIADVKKYSNFCVLGILDEGGPQPGVPATKEDVDDWTAEYHQNFTVAQGTSQAAQTLFNGYAVDGVIGLPFSLYVDPMTMKVKGSSQGYNRNLHADACK